MKKYLIQEAMVSLEWHEVKEERIKPGYVFENTKDIENLFEVNDLTEANNFINAQETAFTIPFRERKVLNLFEFRIVDNESKEVICYSKMPTKESERYEFYDDNANVKYLGIYSFSALKMNFMPSEENKEDCPEEWEKWLDAQDSYDLENLLNYVYDGLSVPYHWDIIEQRKIKYNVYENSVETNLEGIQEGCTFMAIDTCPELLKSFDTEEQALDFLKSKETNVTEVRYNLFAVTEYYLTEEEWDEECEEFLPSGDMIAASDIFSAKLDAMHYVGKVPYLAEGDVCELSNIWDSEQFPKENTIFIPITEEEGLMYEFTVVEKDECNHLNDLIKINTINRSKRY